jgi:hypothetical protein
MANEPTPEKTTDERRSQTEKHNAETERSLAVAQAKLAHGLIENVEKQRSRGKVISLQARITDHISVLRTYVELVSPLIQNNNFSGGYAIIEILNKTMQTYKSILKDFQDTLEIGRVCCSLNWYSESQQFPQAPYVIS